MGELLLSKFKWGKTFFDVNRDVLDLYAACTTSTDVVDAQKRHLEELEKSDRMRRDRGLISLMHTYVSAKKPIVKGVSDIFCIKWDIKPYLTQ